MFTTFITAGAYSVIQISMVQDSNLKWGLVGTAGAIGLALVIILFAVVIPRRDIRKFKGLFQ